MATFSEADYEPYSNREPLQCEGNLTIDDLCTPCGVSCDEQVCDSWKCAIACADQDFESRVFDENLNGTEPRTSIYFRRSNLTSSYPGKTSGKASYELKTYKIVLPIFVKLWT